MLLGYTSQIFSYLRSYNERSMRKFLFYSFLRSSDSTVYPLSGPCILPQLLFPPLSLLGHFTTPNSSLSCVPSSFTTTRHSYGSTTFRKYPDTQCGYSSTWSKEVDRWVDGAVSNTIRSFATNLSEEDFLSVINASGYGDHHLDELREIDIRCI